MTWTLEPPPISSTPFPQSTTWATGDGSFIEAISSVSFFQPVQTRIEGITAAGSVGAVSTLTALYHSGI